MTGRRARNGDREAAGRGREGERQRAGQGERENAKDRSPHSTEWTGRQVRVQGCCRSLAEK